MECTGGEAMMSDLSSEAAFLGSGAAIIALTTATPDNCFEGLAE